MAVTHVTAMRSVLADAVDAQINTGGGTAKVRIREGTTTIVDFNLSNPAFGAAASGVITLNGTPISAIAVAGGTPDNAQIIDRAGTVQLACNVTGLFGGGDIEVSGGTVNNGQTCYLSSLSYAAAP